MQQLLLELAPPPPPTLENFFAGRNGAALKALREALADGERFVFLWGPGGSGKTHLLRAFSEAAAAAKREAAAIDDVGRLGEAEQVALFDLCNRLRGSKGQLHPLSDADKAAALSAHAAGRGMALDRELIAYLLTHFERDMGTQIALLDALDRYSLQRKRAITLPLLKDALRSLAEEARR